MGEQDWKTSWSDRHFRQSMGTDTVQTVCRSGPRIALNSGLSLPPAPGSLAGNLTFVASRSSARLSVELFLFKLLRCYSDFYSQKDHNCSDSCIRIYLF